MKPQFRERAAVSFATVVLSLFSAAGPAKAQSPACPLTDGTLEGLTARVECLEVAIEDAEATHSMLQQVILKLAEDLQMLADELRPTKEVRPFDAVRVASIQWGSHNFTCADPIEAPNNFVLIGGELSDTSQSFSDPGTLGCEDRRPAVPFPTSFCGDPNVCTFKGTSAGCFVNVTWWYWYKAQPSASLSNEDICR